MSSAVAFARLFEAVHEGVYIGALDGPDSRTISANPHLKLMFGFAADTPETEVRPFEPERFVDPQARDGFIARLDRDGAVTDYLLRLRRADRTAIWVEVTAHAEPQDAGRHESRGVDPRRQRAQAPRGPGARPLSPAAAGGEARRAGTDDLRRRARAEQSARDDPDLGRAVVAAARRATRRSDEARPRDDPQRVGTRREDRPQPADVRAQAPHHARDDRRQPGRP